MDSGFNPGYWKIHIIRQLFKKINHFTGPVNKLFICFLYPKISKSTSGVGDSQKLIESVCYSSENMQSSLAVIQGKNDKSVALSGLGQDTQHPQVKEEKAHAHSSLRFQSKAGWLAEAHRRWETVQGRAGSQPAFLLALMFYHLGYEPIDSATHMQGEASYCPKAEQS